uniref:Reverse transcriptase (RNA-dependent DNA polymerase) n=2 Tax=Candidatus Kentrum sp. TC TaxID=2126339 RepID=A0A450Z6K6_9GAMM|nr:MAG: Reverse transcriptase (RNA-dependent DNA polymerase) [Candidatus Kentron sp. TC]
MSPIFELLFHEDSFGFRPERSCRLALELVLGLWQQGCQVVLDADIQGFFDNIPHEVIMSALADVVADGNILGLVERFLRAKNMDN